jgi:hypothetical protein
LKAIIRIFVAINQAILKCEGQSGRRQKNQMQAVKKAPGTYDLQVIRIF